ncbi:MULTISPECIES: hypothetical protein [unclassified Frondihabitans]|uniref:hypothetical protein n=1 Tax=unclassified Frondihabitans TaxID=2626248 RepID=UPI000F4DD01B|nr:MULTISPECIES: hypothetical protein [unclassified Frondihabitans]RPE75201.1 hypothetical protein EDF37_2805 [Frondihabitans sp. PhB153]RPF04443.1 hypothetical protein EDF39_2873 [Frondihabitans sp. PhB161]
MTSYRVGDIPTEDIVLEPVDSEGDPLDLTSFTTATAVLRNRYSGGVVGGDFFQCELLDDEVRVRWPETAIANDPGVLDVLVTLTGPGARLRLAPHPIVVETEYPVTWEHTLETARIGWKGSNGIEDADLYELLKVSLQQVLDYAPATFAQTEAYSLSLKRAQLMQARNIWNAVTASAESQQGQGDFAVSVTVWPSLSGAAKNLVRPKRGVPVVG